MERTTQYATTGDGVRIAFSTKGRGQGSGLGLAICHSLVEALQGALVVKSQPGAGTTVRVLLPAASPGAVLESASVREARSHGND